MAITHLPARMTVSDLPAAGIAHDGPLDATTVRILPLADADGTRIVVTAALR